MRVSSSPLAGSITVVLGMHVMLFFTVGCQSAPPRAIDPFAVQIAVDCGNNRAGYAGPFEVKELAGTVLSAGKPIDGASVVAQNKRSGEMLRTTTDARGKFAFRNVGSATFEVFTCKPGWSSMQFTVQVSFAFSAADFTVELPLERPPY